MLSCFCEPDRKMIWLGKGGGEEERKKSSKEKPSHKPAGNVTAGYFQPNQSSKSDLPSDHTCFVLSLHGSRYRSWELLKLEPLHKTLL